MYLYLDMGSHCLHLLLDSLYQDAIGQVHLEEISSGFILPIAANHKRNTSVGPHCWVQDFNISKGFKGIIVCQTKMWGMGLNCMYIFLFLKTLMPNRKKWLMRWRIAFIVCIRILFRIPKPMNNYLKNILNHCTLVHRKKDKDIKVYTF